MICQETTKMKVTINETKKRVCLKDLLPGTIVSTTRESPSFYYIVTDRYCKWNMETQDYVLSVVPTKHRMTISTKGIFTPWREDDCGFYVIDDVELVVNL